MNVNPFCLSDLVNNLTSQIILDLSATTYPNLGCSLASDSARMVLMKLELQIQFPWGLISFTQRKKVFQISFTTPSHLFWKYTHWGRKGILIHSPQIYRIFFLLN